MNKISCPYCAREIELIKYGSGWVGHCHACSKLVYNESKLPAPEQKTADRKYSTCKC